MDTIPSWIKFSLPGIRFRVLSALVVNVLKTHTLRKLISSLLPNAWGCGKREKKKSPAVQRCRVQEDFGNIKEEGGRGVGLFSSSRLQPYPEALTALPIPAVP